MPQNRCIAIEYVKIVNDGVLDTFLEEHEEVCKVVLMEDNAPIYRDKAAKIGEGTTTLRRLSG